MIRDAATHKFAARSLGPLSPLEAPPANWTWVAAYRRPAAA
jgi:hypothetical protein